MMMSSVIIVINILIIIISNFFTYSRMFSYYIFHLDLSLVYHISYELFSCWNVFDGGSYGLVG